MQIFVQFYPFVIVCSILGLYKGFPKFIVGSSMLMDCVAHLTLDYELGFGFFLFGDFKQFLGMFLLFVFGFKFLYSAWFLRGLFQFFRGKSNSFSPKYISHEKTSLLIDETEEIIEKSNTYSEFDGNLNVDSDEERYESEDCEPDVSELRRLVKTERFRANAALSELEKERAAAATATAEAMAMILKLQSEKSWIEMELSQYKRLCEEKQIHDHEVIQSLQWLVWRHEYERSLVEDELKLCSRNVKQFSRFDESDEEEEEGEESEGCFNGDILDALENVLYSSRDDHDGNNI